MVNAPLQRAQVGYRMLNRILQEKERSDLDRLHDVASKIEEPRFVPWVMPQLCQYLVL